MNNDRVYLTYILECILNIKELTAAGLDSLTENKHHRAAILYYLQTMAETTQRLSDAVKNAHQEVDWVGISGFRNRLVHGYLEVNMDVVWNVIEYFVPQLETAVTEMLDTLNNEGGQ